VSAALRLLVVVVIGVLLVRAARAAWPNRHLALAVWRRIRPRHVIGCLGLLTVVIVVAGTLMALVPFTANGLGSAIGLTGNAVFAPLEEATIRSNGGPVAVEGAGVPASAPWALYAFTAGFLGLLLVLFPWLAYVEERVFREGLEDAALGREVLAALWFGLVHLVMLIPLAAALAVGVAGFFYGRVYRQAYRRAATHTREVLGPFGVPMTVSRPVEQARSEAVLASTVWHTTFNSLIVLLFLGFSVLEWAGAL
jgi:hypothetical protein